MTTPVPSFFDGSSSFLQVTRPSIKDWMSLNSSKIPSLTLELAALEQSMNNVVTALVPSFLIGSSPFLQASRKPIISRMGSKFGRIRPGTYELPALEQLKNPHRPIMGEMLVPI